VQEEAMVKQSGTNSNSKKDATEKIGEFVDQATDSVAKSAKTMSSATERIIDVVQQFADKFTVTSPKICIQDCVGKEAEVSVSVPPNGTGEVIITIGGAHRQYSARGKDGRKTFKRGTKVRVVDVGTSTVYVDEDED
jgi:hypothetical protein